MNHRYRQTGIVHWIDRVTREAHSFIQFPASISHTFYSMRAYFQHNSIWALYKSTKTSYSSMRTSSFGHQWEHLFEALLKSALFSHLSFEHQFLFGLLHIIWNAVPLIFLSEAEGLIFITFFMAFAEKHCQHVNKHLFIFFYKWQRRVVKYK